MTDSLDLPEWQAKYNTQLLFLEEIKENENLLKFSRYKKPFISHHVQWNTGERNEKLNLPIIRINVKVVSITNLVIKRGCNHYSF